MSHLEELRKLLHDMPELKGEVTPDAHLVDDLELDSVCFFELVTWLDSSYGIEPGTYSIKSIQYVRDILRLLHERGKKL